MRKTLKASGPFRMLLSVSCPLLASGVTLTATPPSLAPSDQGLDALIVSARRLPANAERITSSVTQLPPRKFEERGIFDLKSALNAVPGVISTSTSGQSGAIGSLFIRGTTTPYSQVVVDGVRLSDSTAPLGNFLAGARIDDLDRIEVLRGPHSAIHGGEAVGGVLWLETARGSEKPTSRLMTEAGSFDSFATHASTRGQSGDLTWFAGLGHEGTDNDSKLQRFEQNRGALRLEWEQNESTALGLTFRSIDSRFDYPAYGSNRDHLDAALGTLYAQTELAAGWDARFTVGHYRENYDNENLSEYGTSLYGTDLDRSSVATDQSIQLSPNHTLLWGAFFENTDFQNSIGSDLSRDRLGSYTGLEWLPSDQLTTTAILRWEDYAAHGEEVTWRCAAAWQAAKPGPLLRGGIGRAFRTPTYLDLFGTSYGAGNPDLEAESSTGWDLGIEQALGEHHRIALTWFANSIENRIRSYPTPPVNLSGTTPARGIESSLSGSWRGSKLGYQLSWTWLEESLSDQPAHSANASLDWRPDQRWLFGIGASYLDDHSWGGLPLEGYVLVRLHASYQANEQLRLHARIENLLDRDYQLANFNGAPPIDGAGLGLFTGATLTF